MYAGIRGFVIDGKEIRDARKLKGAGGFSTTYVHCQHMGG